MTLSYNNKKRPTEKRESSKYHKNPSIWLPLGLGEMKTEAATSSVEKCSVVFSKKVICDSVW